jgi:LysM repeat protein
MIKLLFLIAFSLNPESPKDSIGMETVNGKMFVIHKVDEKETLFAISRRYRTTVDAILQYNTGAGSGLEIGQILKVPYTPKTVTRATDGTVHKVAAKETLYSISRLYQVSMDDLKKWNNLVDNSLRIGQELVIKGPGKVSPVIPGPKAATTSPVLSKTGVHTVQVKETLFSISKDYNVSPEQLKSWNNLDGNELKIGQTLYVSQPDRGTVIAKSEPAAAKPTPPVVTRQETPVATPTPTVRNTAPAKPDGQTQSAQSIRISESLKNGDEIIEGGLAELIEGTEGNRKYLALHRSAPMGTILKVRNEMNNREVFVRVMGKLPDTALTDKLVIKISKSAYDRLGAIDPRFRVEVTYYK